MNPTTILDSLGAPGNEEKNYFSNDNEIDWDYGHVLAAFVWVPVLVEYSYVPGWRLKLERDNGRRYHLAWIELC